MNSLEKELLSDTKLTEKTMAKASPKNTRVDGQMTGLAGEFFVAAELLKRNIQVAVTFGNAKAIDLCAHNSITGRSFNVQVKALRSPNYFPISHEKVNELHVYVFVVLNKPGEQPNFFIVSGKQLREEPERFGKYFWNWKTFPGIHSKELSAWKDKWEIFQPKDQRIAESDSCAPPVTTNI